MNTVWRKFRRPMSDGACVGAGVSWAVTARSAPAVALDDVLAAGERQMRVSMHTIGRVGVTVDDLPAVAAHLIALAEHGQVLAGLCGAAAEEADDGHPLRATGHGQSADLALGHAFDLLDAVAAFAGTAGQELAAMAAEPGSRHCRVTQPGVGSARCHGGAVESDEDLVTARRRVRPVSS